MIKYLLFFIVFTVSFMINITLTEGKAKKSTIGNDQDVYYKKTKVFREWNEDIPSFSISEKKLLLLTREKLIKTEKKKEETESKAPAISESKFYNDLIMGRVKPADPVSFKKKSQTPLADYALKFPIKPIQPEKGVKVYQEEKKKIFVEGTEPRAPAILESNFYNDLIMGRVKPADPVSFKKKSQTPLADYALKFPIKPFQPEKRRKIYQGQENKIFIFGSHFEQNCHWEKDGCGFPISKQLKPYDNKITPQREPVDTRIYPIDF